MTFPLYPLICDFAFCDVDFLDCDGVRKSGRDNQACIRKGYPLNLITLRKGGVKDGFFISPFHDVSPANNFPFQGNGI